MRRADRLFQIVQIIRGRRLTTAAYLADRLEISLRSVYRDVADLQRQGVPIEGEAGMGYRFGSGFDLPPLMFTRTEAQALVAAVRIAREWVDPALGMASQQALEKVMSALPTSDRAAAESLIVMAPPVGLEPGVQQVLQQLREAAQSRHKIHVTYRDAAELRTERTLRPLGVFYWGKVWTLAAWCESRQDFRNFRADRIESIKLRADTFRDEPGKTFADLMRLFEKEHAAEQDQARSS